MPAIIHLRAPPLQPDVVGAHGGALADDGQPVHLRVVRQPEGDGRLAAHLRVLVEPRLRHQHLPVPVGVRGGAR